MASFGPDQPRRRLPDGVRVVRIDHLEIPANDLEADPIITSGGTYAGFELQQEVTINDPRAGEALAGLRIGARTSPTRHARDHQEALRRLEWEAGDPGCRTLNRATRMLEQRASLRRGELRRRQERQHHRRARAAYTAAALIAVGPLLVAGLR